MKNSSRSYYFSAAQLLMLRQLPIPMLSAAAADQNPQENLNKLLPGDEYIRVALPVGANGTIQLLDATTLKQYGISTFDKARLATGLKMILDQIRFGWAEVTTSGALSAASQTYTTNQTNCPAPLKAAHLVIRQNNIVIQEIPVQRLLSLGGIEGMVGDDSYEVMEKRLLLGESEFDISLRFPDAAAAVAWIAAKTTFVEIHLIGPKIQERIG